MSAERRTKPWEPIETTGYALDDRDALIEVVRARIEALRHS